MIGIDKGEDEMKVRSVTVYYVFSIWTRIFHWLMAIAIGVLFITGLYIGNPSFIGSQGIEPTFAIDSWTSMSTIRFIHFTAGYILMASFIFRIYGFAVHKGDRMLPKPWTKLFWSGLVDMGLHYGFMRSAHRPYLRNSMARAGYGGVYAMIFLEAATGFSMYGQINPNGLIGTLFGFINHLFVDEYIVHLVHHYVAWMIIFFVIIHVYMATRADMTEKYGEISAMISGVKFYDAEPDDIGDIK
jgi:Ni/Fe-hydrogenase 1 B-type cytochrome subunit